MSGQKIKNIALSSDGSAVRIVDQTRLPGQLRYIELRDREAMYEAIQKLRIRGAPAIGIFAGYCVYVLARGYGEGDFFDRLDADCDYLISCRPTAVNLARQVERQRALARSMQGAPVRQIVDALGREARAIHDEDIAMCRAIAQAGLSLLRPGDTAPAWARCCWRRSGAST